MLEVKELIEQIEALRAKLIEVKQGRRFTDPEVIKVSQKLDELLDMYQEITNESISVKNKYER